jgi:hypothetical protein
MSECYTEKDLGDYEFSQGRFRGMTFEQVAKRHEWFCRWVKEKRPTHGGLRKFLQYLEER